MSVVPKRGRKQEKSYPGPRSQSVIQNEPPMLVIQERPVGQSRGRRKIDVEAIAELNAVEDAKKVAEAWRRVNARDKPKVVVAPQAMAMEEPAPELPGLGLPDPNSPPPPLLSPVEVAQVMQNAPPPIQNLSKIKLEPASEEDMMQAQMEREAAPIVAPLLDMVPHMIERKQLPKTDISPLVPIIHFIKRALTLRMGKDLRLLDKGKGGLDAQRDLTYTADMASALGVSSIPDDPYYKRPDGRRRYDKQALQMMNSI